MKPSSIPNKTTALALNQKAIHGVDKYFAHVKTFTLAGTVYTPASLKAVLQAEIDANKAVDDGQAQLQQQVVAAQLARAKARGARQGLKAYVLGTSGADAVQMLKDLGIPVPKPRGIKSAKSKAEAVDAATATRQAKKEAIASIDAPPPAPPALPAASVSPSKS
jgi:hypothetical protein